MPKERRRAARPTGPVSRSQYRSTSSVKPRDCSVGRMGCRGVDDVEDVHGGQEQRGGHRQKRRNAKRARCRRTKRRSERFCFSRAAETPFVIENDVVLSVRRRIVFGDSCLFSGAFALAGAFLTPIRLLGARCDRRVALAFEPLDAPERVGGSTDAAERRRGRFGAPPTKATTAEEGLGFGLRSCPRLARPRREPPRCRSLERRARPAAGPSSDAAGGAADRRSRIETLEQRVSSAAARKSRSDSRDRRRDRPALRRLAASCGTPGAAKRHASLPLPLRLPLFFPSSSPRSVESVAGRGFAVETVDGRERRRRRRAVGAGPSPPSRVGVSLASLAGSNTFDAGDASRVASRAAPTARFGRPRASKLASNAAVSASRARSGARNDSRRAKDFRRSNRTPLGRVRLVGRADCSPSARREPRRPQLQGGRRTTLERLVRRVGVRRPRRRRAPPRVPPRARNARASSFVSDRKTRLVEVEPPDESRTRRRAMPRPESAAPLRRRRTPRSLPSRPRRRARQHLARGRVPQVHFRIRGVAVYGTASRGRAVRLRLGRPRQGRCELPRRRIHRRHDLPQRRRARETSTRARRWPRGKSNESLRIATKLANIVSPRLRS